MNEQRKGELYIILQAAMWGLFPVITILSYDNLSPLVSLLGSVVFASVFFFFVVLVKNKWSEIANPAALKDILATTLFNGVLYYVLFFVGLKYTSAGNASIIGLSEVLFSYLFFHLWRKHFIPVSHIIGSILALSGALIVLFPHHEGFHLGDFLVLAAAMVAPFGNYFQQRSREKTSSEVIMLIRSAISAVVVLILILILGEKFSISAIQHSLPILLINGLALFGLGKILWIEGIHRISVTKANALSSASPLLTLIFAWLILRQSPTPWQLLALIPMFFGVILLGTQVKPAGAQA